MLRFILMGFNKGLLKERSKGSDWDKNGVK